MKVPSKPGLEFMSFTAFFVTLIVYSPNMFVLQEDLNAEALLGVFVPWLLASVLVVSIVVAILSSKGLGSRFIGRTAVTASAVLYIVGYIALIACVLAHDVAEPLLAAIAVALSVGTVGLCITWGSLFSLLDMRQVMLILSLTIGIASAMQLVMQMLPPLARLSLFGAFVVLGSVPLAFLTRKLSQVKVEEVMGALQEMPLRDTLAPGADTAAVDARRDSGARRMARVIVTPLIGLLVFAYLTGVRKFIIFDFFYAELFGALIASVITLVFCFVKTGRPLISLYFQLLLPLFALLLIVLNSFPVHTLPMIVAASVSYVFFSLVAILALVSICGMAHAREFHPASIFSLVLAAYAVVSIAGVYSGRALLFLENEDGGPILLVISTIYFAFLILMPIVSGWRREESEDVSSADAVEPIVARCAVAVKRGALSPREAEILAYLGRGHSIAFIAKTLVISESTVRTHAKSIYRKLDVSSKEELLDFIDSLPTDNG